MSGWQALAPEKMTGCKKTQRKPWNLMNISLIVILLEN
jgi:hypothetical protein